MTVNELLGDPRADLDLLTPEQVAALLKVKRDRIYEAVQAKRLRAVRVGRLLRFRRQDVEAFIRHSLTA